MAPVLFHPKKKPIFTQRKAQGGAERPTPSTSQDTSGTSTPSPTPPSPTKPKPKVPRPPRAKEDEDGLPKLEGPYAEFRLMSSALNGWKYDVMKFDSRKPVDILNWARPVKLNRKEVRRHSSADDAASAAPVPVGPMLGPDNKPVIGADGRVVMVDAEGKPIRPGEQAAATESKGKEKEKPSAAKKKFQKKTKQVFLVPDHIRQLRREERYPWVMEDGAGQETWTAAMEEVSKAETQAMFMPAANDIFKFVPAHRWYKFQKKPNHHVPSLDEAEDLMKQLAKNKDPERWLLRRRNGQGPSDATAAIFKAEREGSMPPSASSLVYATSQSVGPGGRKLKAVDSGADNLFGDDDDDDGGDNKRRKREYGAEGDLDELDFEEDVQDDDEKIEPDGEDEEAKELEERLKREYKTANKTREGYIDESEEEDDNPELSGAGKDMRKLMKKLEKNGAYDESDDDKNPYASSDEEEPEEEPPQVPQGPAIIAPEPRPQSRQPSQAPGTPAPSGAKSPTQPPATLKNESGSRATSPIPGHGGHAMVAQRATSPKAPKLKTNGASRATSPLAGGSQPTSPTGSPIATRADSPPMGGKPGKRKAEDGAGGAPSKPKKRKGGAAPAPDGELEDWMLVEWLKKSKNSSTRDCIHHFTPWLTTEDKKQNFTRLVKEVAQLKGGILVLRPAYRGTGAPNSPTPGSPVPMSPTANGA